MYNISVKKGRHTGLSAIHFWRLVMRVSVLNILILTGGLQLLMADPGSGQSLEDIQIAMELRNEPLVSAFQKIEQKTDFLFAYREEQVNGYRTNLDGTIRSLKEALGLILAGTQLEYQVVGNKIIVKRKLPTAPVRRITEWTPASLINQLQTLITGKVTDSRTGEPLPGANIFIKGTNWGSATNAEGRYVLEGIEPGMYTFIVTFIGYEPEEQKVSISDGEVVELNFSMELAVKELRGVEVNAGYYSVKDRLKTGNISTIDAEDIEKQPVTNFLSALQGRAPGLRITPLSGKVGSAPDIQVRGRNSIASGTYPLIIVDGMPVPEQLYPSYYTQGYLTLDSSAFSLLLNINPSDIQQVNVLKDADATSLYGSRGANGVIVIETKRGNVNGLEVDVNASTSFKTVGHTVDFLTAEQYKMMRSEAMENDGITPDQFNAPDLLEWNDSQTYDWQEEFLGKTNVTQDINVSVSGGSESTKYYVSSGYQGEGAVTPGDRNFNRKSIRASLNHISQDDRFLLDMVSVISESNLNLNQQSLVGLLNIPPYYPIYDESGMPNWDGALGFPLAYTMQPYDNKSRNYSGNISARYELLEGLNIKLNAGFNNNTTDQSIQIPLSTLNPQYYTTGEASVSAYRDDSWIVEPQVGYSKAFQGHNVELLLGGTFQKRDINSETIQGTNFASDALLGDIGSAGFKNITTSTSLYAYTSIYSRLSYDYDQEFLVNVSFRRDGSSRFGPDNRFGNFGAVGLGWIFTKNEWMKPFAPFISFGKIRTSYGITGNDQIGDYRYLSTYGSSATTRYSYNGFTLTPLGIANPDYSWEKTKKFEVALELELFSSRVYLSTSFFRDQSDNQLVSYRLSPQTGFTGYQANFPATVQNQGFEIELRTHNIRNANFSWTTSLNLTHSKNLLKSFDGIENTSYFSIYEVGESLNARQGFVYEGLNNTGIPVFTDINQDGRVDYSDTKIVGDNDPFYGGLSNQFSYNNLSFSFFIDYSRISGFNNLIPRRYIGGFGQNVTQFHLDRWQEPGDEQTTDIPRFTTGGFPYPYDVNQYKTSDLWWDTQHIFRLRNVALSYTLPTQLTQKLNIARLGLYVQAQNLWVWDKNKEYRLDPSTGNDALPPLRTITFGINFSL